MPINSPVDLRKSQRRLRPFIMRRKRNSNRKNFYEAVLSLSIQLAYVSCFSVLRCGAWIQRAPASRTNFFSKALYNERSRNLSFIPTAHMPNTQQQSQLLQTRQLYIDERTSLSPKRRIKINEEALSSYDLVDWKLKKSIKVANNLPVVPIDQDESTTKIERQRAPRVTMNVNPATIRHSNIKTSSSTMASSKKTRKSRSSTMPGFASINTKKQRAFRDGVRLIEENTGRKYIDTPEAKRLRRKVNGEIMYKNSPSVPDSLLQFATEIHQEERISRKEEIELGEKTQEAIRLQHLFDSLADRLGREPTDDEWCAAAGKINMAAIGQAIEDGIAAKNKLVTSNLRMVQSVVNTYIRNGLSAQYNAGDLMQEGIMALIRAAEKFEPDRGWKFSTYAMYWVRASVKRSQVYQSRIIQVPQRLSENHKRLKRLEKEIIASTGKRPTMRELGALAGMSEEQVIKCMRAMSQRCYSLDQEIQNTLKPSTAGDSKDTMIEIVESKSKPNIQNEFDRYERVMLREDLVETLNRYLPPKEAELLLVRYGLKQGPCIDDREAKVSSDGNKGASIGDQPATIAELSRMFNIKPDKIRRMIDQSLKHLNGVGLDEWLAFERDLP